jgi:hypothetical protein
MEPKSTLWLTLAVVFVALFGSPARADVIMDWNAQSDAIVAQKQIRPTAHARTQTLLHLAMFEAVNAIERRYLPYRLDLSADRNTSREAAAASAAHDVLISIYPDQRTALGEMLSKSLAAVAEGEPKAKGIELGKKAAAEMIALRANDGFDAPEHYRPHTSPRLCADGRTSLLHRGCGDAMGDDERLAIPSSAPAGARFRDLDARPE